jgi:hypothetical protein
MVLVKIFYRIERWRDVVFLRVSRLRVGMGIFRKFSAPQQGI